MAEQLLELWQGAAEVEVMHGKGVAQGVRVYALADAAALYGVSDNILHASLAERLAWLFYALE